MDLDSEILDDHASGPLTNADHVGSRNDCLLLGVSKFLSLPLEVRIIIYEDLIRSSIVDRKVRTVYNYSTSSSEAPRIDPHHFDLSITTTRVSFLNLRRPSNVMFANRQTYDEMSALIYSRIRHLKLTGDFLLGLTPTAAIFRILERRPWIQTSTRSVTIVLKFDHVFPLVDGVAVNSAVAEQYPWLCSHLRLAELNVRKFNAQDRTIKSDSWFHQYLLRKMTLGRQSLERVFPWLQRPSTSPSNEHNTLPDLAKLFETFPLLEKIDIQSDNRILFSLFQAPKETALSFLPLHTRGVEVNVLLHDWQVSQFCSMLYRNGVETGSITFTSSGQTMVILSYESLVRGDVPSGKVVSFRLLDCIVPERDIV